MFRSLPPLGRGGAPHTAGWVTALPTAGGASHGGVQNWSLEERCHGGGRRDVVACRVKNKEGASKEEKAQ